jgi:hypothetical protein
MRTYAVTLASFVFLFGCGGDLSGAGSSGHPNAGGSDAGAGATEGAATTCGTIRAADYDQTCSVDSDCVGVHEGDLCQTTQCTNCTNAAIRGSAEAKYQADLSAKVASPIVCPCPLGPPVICAKGVCGVGP